MADERKTPAPAPSTTPQKTSATPKAAAYTPNPDRPTSSEWADKDGPPVTPAPPFGYGSKRIDIYPRPPLDPTDFLNLQAGGCGDFLPGLPGMIADKGPNDKISRVPETDIPFGAVVAVGTTGDGYCKVAGAAGDKVLGIAMRDTTSVGATVNLFAPNGGSTEVFPKDHWAVPIIRYGRVWAIPTTAVHEGDPVGFGANGALQTGGHEIDGWYWATSAPANMLAQVQVNPTSAAGYGRT